MIYKERVHSELLKFSVVVFHFGPLFVWGFSEVSQSKCAMLESHSIADSFSPCVRKNSECNSHALRKDVLRGGSHQTDQKVQQWPTKMGASICLLYANTPLP